MSHGSIRLHRARTHDVGVHPCSAAWQGTGIGCGALVLGFLLTGPVFLYLYLSRAPTRRGNPVLGLVAGILFTALGLLGLSALVAGRRRR